MDKYNYYFNIGDPSCDGHGMTETFHIEINHSSNEIYEAYKKITKKLEGFDYIKDFCSDYGDSKLDISVVKLLQKIGILVGDYLYDYQLKELKHNKYTYLEVSDYICIFFAIIKTEIPDLEWNLRNFEEDLLDILDGAGYGFFTH